MRRRHLIFLLVILLVNNLFYSQSTDSSAVILNIKDTIISTGKSKSLINPRDLELKQKSYWEALSDKNKNSETDEYEESLYKPMISFGIGTLSFFGDVGDTLPRIKR